MVIGEVAPHCCSWFKPPVPKVGTPAAGSGSRPSSASSGAVEAESLVAGSGNPASSVSSGRVEAEGCGSKQMMMILMVMLMKMVSMISMI